MKPSDHCTLYRKLATEKYGIALRRKPEINLDRWLDPQSDNFRPVIAQAAFHYSPRLRSEPSSRLEICVASAQMKSDAWQYAHDGFIQLDGTFGVCDRKILLFVAMTCDEKSRGRPLALFFFSAPKNNVLTSSGYDNTILARLLLKWKEALEISPYSRGRSFTVKVAMTDNDARERIALAKTWPSIHLLLCKVGGQYHTLLCNLHLKQVHRKRSWYNHLKPQLPGLSDADKAGIRVRVEQLWHQCVR